MLRIDRTTALRFRLRVSHLDARLASLPRAARGGLQDSAPRAGVISLHARAEGVGPDSWEDPSLAQIWFRGGADYIVPRADVGVFTIGAQPRDVQRIAHLEKIADRVVAFLDGRAIEVRDVEKALDLDPTHFLIKHAGVTGRLLIRWNASRIWLIGNDRPDIDPEDARRELARRFLHWFAPATLQRFAWWANLDPDDARLTWEALDVREVELEGERRSVLVDDLDALVGAGAVSGVRLLPHGDPFIKFDAELVVRNPERRKEVFPSLRAKPDFWPVSGGVLLHGEFVGSWARQQRRVTVNPWKRLSKTVRHEVETEALSFPIAARSPASVTWTQA